MTLVVALAAVALAAVALAAVTLAVVVAGGRGGWSSCCCLLHCWSLLR